MRRGPAGVGGNRFDRRIARHERTGKQPESAGWRWEIAERAFDNRKKPCERTERHRDVTGKAKENFVALSGVFGALGVVLPALGRVFGGLGNVLPAFGRVFGTLGVVLPAFGRVLGGLGNVLPAFGRVFEALGNVLPAFGRVFGGLSDVFAGLAGRCLDVGDAVPAIF